MISDYLPEALAAQLDKHLGLPPVEISSPSAEVTEPPAKRQKVKSEHSEPTEDYTKGFTAQPSAVCFLMFSLLYAQVDSTFFSHRRNRSSRLRRKLWPQQRRARKILHLSSLRSK